jgi:signal transduction histidine kinase
MDPANDNAALRAKIAELEATVKLRTDQLIASTSRAYSFLDSLSMGFIMCDVNPEVVLTNQTVRKLLGAEGELTLVAVDQILQPDFQLKQHVLESLGSGKPQEYNEVNFSKGVLRVFIAPMVNESDQQKLGVIILLENITEQKNLERSKEEFLSIASHELRTPLTAIRGNSALIKKYYGERLPDKDVSEMINDIHESSVRLIEIVNDFLDVSSLEQGKMNMTPESFLIQDVVTDVFRELQSLVETKGVQLIADQSLATSPAVTADKHRTKQVIYNLVGNAVKFTEKGSITIGARADDGFVYTIVTDTGRGMSAENQHLLFRKFQQASSSLLTRDTTKGTGLGLYISKLIIELSGGKIGLQNSTLDKGSSFVFSLPRTK